MGLSRWVALAFGVVPVLAACNDDNEFGLGVGNGDRYTASLSGANVRPVPVATGATATAEVTIREPQVGQSSQTVTVTITTSSLTSATAAHIHIGGASVANGPIIATLYTNPSDTTITSSELVTFTGSENSLGVSLDSLATLVAAGAAYVDIHTKAYPDGLIRGQLMRSGQTAVGDLFAAPVLTGAKERPNPVLSNATGSATFELLPNATVRYQVNVAGLTGATMSHIHVGVADSAGPIAVGLFATTTPTGTLTGTLASGTFAAGDIQLTGVSMDSLLALMRLGRTYVNVHTVANPSGEIRAQIEPVSVLPK